MTRRLTPLGARRLIIASTLLITAATLVRPEAKPLVVSLVISTDAWSASKPALLDDAVREFNDEHPIEVDGRALTIDAVAEPSGDAEDALAGGDLEADVWIPASSIWRALLNRARPDSTDVEAPSRRGLARSSRCGSRTTTRCAPRSARSAGATSRSSPPTRPHGAPPSAGPARSGWCTRTPSS